MGAAVVRRVSPRRPLTPVGVSAVESGAERTARRTARADLRRADRGRRALRQRRVGAADSRRRFGPRARAHRPPRRRRAASAGPTARARRSPDDDAQLRRRVPQGRNCQRALRPPGQPADQRSPPRRRAESRVSATTFRRHRAPRRRPDRRTPEPRRTRPAARLPVRHATPRRLGLGTGLLLVAQTQGR